MAHIYRTFSRIGVLALVFVLVITGFSPANAKGPVEEGSATLDEHIIVSSDGKPVKENLTGSFYDKDGPYIPSKQGTGEQARGADAVAHDKGVDFINEQQENPQNVIGTDNRVRIYGTTNYPYSAVVHFTYTINGRSSYCSGWLIGPDTVATAGHCVYYYGQWVSNVQVYPGRNGSSAPFGSCGVRTMYTVQPWVDTYDWNYDYGALKLNCTIGYNTGWFGFRVAPDAGLIGQQSLNTGYPGDKPYGTMWHTASTIGTYTTQKLFYQNDTAGGNSGSPIYNGTSRCWPCGIGIHTNGTGYYHNNYYNSGVRISLPVYNNLLTWRNS